jgi:hypothetical protein
MPKNNRVIFIPAVQDNAIISSTGDEDWMIDLSAKKKFNWICCLINQIEIDGMQIQLVESAVKLEGV